LQTITVKNDRKALEQLIASDQECTYLKTPSGIFTEVTLPVDEIKSAHVNDSLLSVSVDFNRLNNLETLSKYTFAAPKKVLLIQKDSLNSFFEKNQNYNNKYAFYTTLSKNAYSFSGSSDINNLIVKMYNDRKAGLKQDPNWVEKHPDWNKVVLVPIVTPTFTTSTVNNTSVTSTSTPISHQIGLTSTQLVGGKNSPIEIKVIYAEFF
jgi:hypothetical protein